MTALTSQTAGGGFFSDIRSFVLHKPPVPTLIEFDTVAAREDYSLRISQRLGIDVTQYSVLNVHRVGVNAPTQHVFEELLRWDGSPSYWPNRIVKVERSTVNPGQLEFFLLGRKNSILFRMDLAAAQHLPDDSNFDNARYLLYMCSGGYPVGVCGIYVRSPIADLGETEAAQVFFAVGFNFYGKRRWTGQRVVNRMWEGIHNRVTANVLTRFKRQCEEGFRRVQAGSDSG